MRIRKTNVKIVAFLLSLLILFQSCRVYQHRSVSLKTAYDKGRRVKIKTKGDQIYKFDRIVFENESFYGVKKKRKKLLKTLLNPNELKSVRMHNKTMSVIYGIVIGSTIIMVGVFAIALATWDGIGIGAINFTY